jgi:hypothetical protein
MERKGFRFLDSDSDSDSDSKINSDSEINLDLNSKIKKINPSLSSALPATRAGRRASQGRISSAPPQSANQRQNLFSPHDYFV